jgi:hypothetical protein
MDEVAQQCPHQCGPMMSWKGRKHGNELWFLAGEAWSLKVEDFGHVGSNTMDKEYR